MQFTPDTGELKSTQSIAVMALDTSVVTGPFLLSLCCTIVSFIKWRAWCFPRAAAVEAGEAVGMTFAVPFSAEAVMPKIPKRHLSE